MFWHLSDRLNATLRSKTTYHHMTRIQFYLPLFILYIGAIFHARKVCKQIADHYKHVLTRTIFEKFK